MSTLNFIPGDPRENALFWVIIGGLLLADLCFTAWFYFTRFTEKNKTPGFGLVAHILGLIVLSVFLFTGRTAPEMNYNLYGVEKVANPKFEDQIAKEAEEITPVTAESLTLERANREKAEEEQTRKERQKHLELLEAQRVQSTDNILHGK